MVFYGTVIDVQVFTRDGVEKDKRCQKKLKTCNCVMLRKI